jgi:uncharacterized protein YecA (UPF0149 family)
MDTRDGKIISQKEYDKLPDSEKQHYTFPGNLTERQIHHRQVDKYDPCPCGSGKKFKWCCWAGNQNAN